MGNIRRACVLLATVSVAVMLGACSSPAPEPAVEEEEETVASPVSYPVPEGCPTGEEFGLAYVNKDDWAVAVDYSTLSSLLSDQLPDGGCGYVVGETGTTDDGVAFERVIVAYFNLDTPDRPAHESLFDWATAIGGTPTDVDSVDLPQSFTGFTNASFVWVDGVNSQIFVSDEPVIPAYTQGASGKIEFYLDAEDFSTVTSASASGVDVDDPTQALPAGLRMRSTVAFDAVDDEGYSASYEVTVEVDPYVTDVANSAPGELEVLSSSTTYGVVTNTTSERNTKTASVHVYALYPLDSAPCTWLTGVSVTGDDWQDPSYCQVKLGSVYGPELAPGGSQEVPGGLAESRFGPYAEDGSAVDVFNNPIAVYAALDPQRMVTRTDWTSDKGCLAKLNTTSIWAIVMDGWPDPICSP